RRVFLGSAGPRAIGMLCRHKPRRKTYSGLHMTVYKKKALTAVNKYRRKGCVLLWCMVVLFSSAEAGHGVAQSQDINDGVANVRKFGAKGDGVTDDNGAIRAAMNAGPVILFPPGTYMITDNLVINKSNVTLLGFGMGVSTLRIKTLWTKSPSSSTTVPAMINIIGTPSARIANIEIRG